MVYYIYGTQKFLRIRYTVCCVCEPKSSTCTMIDPTCVPGGDDARLEPDTYTSVPVCCVGGESPKKWEKKSLRYAHTRFTKLEQ